MSYDAHPHDLKAIVREIRPDTSATEAARIEHGATLVRLFEAEIPKTAVLDYFAVNVLGVARDDWLRVRSVTRQALQANIDRAEKRLPDAAVEPKPGLPTEKEVSLATGYIDSAKARTATVQILKRHGPTTPTELADIRGVATATASDQLRKLRERNIARLAVPESATQTKPHELTTLGGIVAGRLN